MKLNIGCGMSKREDCLNVDIAPEVNPDMVLDVTKEWPFDNGSFDEIFAIHVVEHLSDLNAFMIQAYRCMAPEALMHIAVPHPRSDFYISDPTHVTPVNENVLQLYDREQCLDWKEKGFSNTPMALMIGVDFRIVSATAVADDDWKECAEKDPVRMKFAMRHFNNVVHQLEFVLRRV